MIPVYQDSFGYGQGNCFWACMASIFDRPLDDFRHLRAGGWPEDIQAWLAENHPELRLHQRDLGYNFRLHGSFTHSDDHGVGEQRWTYDLPDEWEPPPVDLWIATVYSPALRRPVSDPYWPLPALHACVYRGGRFVHDPNRAYQFLKPERTVVIQTWFQNAESPGTGIASDGA